MYEDCRSRWEQDYGLHWSRSSARTLVSIHAHAIDIFLQGQNRYSHGRAGCRGSNVLVPDIRSSGLVEIEVVILFYMLLCNTCSMHMPQSRGVPCIKHPNSPWLQACCCKILLSVSNMFLYISCTMPAMKTTSKEYYVCVHFKSRF